MLVLTRKLYQTIRIGPEIVVTVQRIDGRERRVRIGIDAPDHVQILRGEILDRDDDDERPAA